MNPEFIITILVKARNQIAGVLQKAASDVDALTKAQDRSTASQRKQADATKSTTAAMQDATKRFEAYTAEVERGTKSGEAAEKQLRSFASEFDNLGRRAKAGSDVSDSFFQMGQQAKVMATDVRAAYQQVDQDAKDSAKQVASSRQAEADAMVRAVRQELAADAQRDKQFTQNLAAREAATRRSLSAMAQAEQQSQRQSEAASRAESAASELASRQAQAARAAEAKSFLADVRSDIAGDAQRAAAFDKNMKSGESAYRRRISTVQQGREAVEKLRQSELDAAKAVESLDRVASSGGGGGGQSFLSRIFGDVDPDKLDRINKVLSDFGSSADNSSFSAVKLAGNLRGMVIIGALVFFQQLVGAGISLGGALVSIASAAAQAGAALGGAFVAGAAQALPVVGLLAGAWQRVTAVFNAVQQQQKANQKSSDAAITAADQQASAADSLTSAQEGLAQAHRQVTVAQEALTKARHDAVRQIQDLVTAEKEAVLQAEASKLALTDAQASFAQAVRGGDTSSLAADSLQVRSARLQSSTSSRDVTRATADANKAVGLGVSGQPDVVSAQRSLDDANRGVGDAQRQLEAARRSAVTAAADVGSAQKTLNELLAQLSPAEKGLYDALTKLLARYKAVFNGPGGVLETIIGSFTFGVKRASALLNDPALISSARKLASSISTQLKGAFSFLTGPKQVGFIEEMSDDARKNLPTLTSILKRIATLFENIAKAASPALSAFLGFLDDLIGKADRATGSGSGLDKLRAFFSQGEKFAESFVKLGLAIAGLFLAIIGTSAKQGNGAIQSITKSIQDATKWIDSHQKQVRSFFSQAIKSAGDVMSTLGAVAKFLFDMFNPKQVKAFADAMKNTILPALSSVFKVLGTVAGVILQITGTKVGRTLLEFGLAFLALSKLISFVVAPVIALAGGFAILTGSADALEVLGVSATAAFGGIGLAVAAAAAAVLLLNGKFHFLGPTIEGVKTAVSGVVDWFKVHWPLVVAIFGGPIGLIVVVIAKFWRQIGGVFVAGVEVVVGFFKTMFTRFIAQIEKYGSEILSIVPAPFKKIGSAMAAGIVAGFKDLVYFFVNIGKWLFDNIIKPIYDFFEIGSPSKLFHRIGGQLIQGLINGLEEAVKGIAGALVGVGEAIVKGIVKGISDAPGALISAITNLLPGPVRSVASKALGLAVDVALPPVGIVHGVQAVAGVASGAFHSIFGGGGSKLASKPAARVAAPDPTRVIAQALSSVPDDASTQNAFVKQWTTFWQKIVGVATTGKTTVNGQFFDIQWYATDQINKLYQNARDTLIDLQTSFEYRSQSIVDIWDSAWQDIQTITFKGLTYVATETNAALKSLGSKVIDFGLTAPQFDQTNPLVATHAAGGAVSGPGTGTSDSIPARLSNGEHVWTANEVANAGGHGAVYAMRKLFGAGGGSGGAGFATGGAVVDDHTGDLTQGQEPQLLTAVRKLASYLRTTIEIISAYRTPAHSVAVGGFADDPHTKGEAMDIGVPGGFLYSRSADSVLARFGLYRPFYPASAKEYDHVQLLAGAAAGIKGSALAGAASAKPLVDALRKLVAPHVEGAGPMSKLAQSILDRAYKQARKQVSKVQSAASSMTGGAGGDLSGFSSGGGSSSANQTLGRRMMLAFGFPGGEWPSLRTLWDHESGWSTTAGSPGAAFGIPQADPGNKMASVGADWLTNAATQIKWGLQYIKARYKLPSVAWSGWYGGNFAGTPYAGDYGYAGGGAVSGPGTGSSDSVPARLSKGEHVWTAAEVVRAGGHQAMYAMRRLLGGGGQASGSSFASGGAAYSEPLYGVSTGSALFTQLAAARTIAAGFSSSTITSKFTDALSKTLNAVVGDNGLIDQLTQAVQNLSDKLVANLERVTYKITRSGQIVQQLSAAQVADRTVDELQQVYARMLAEQVTIQAQLDDVNKRIRAGGLSDAAKQQLRTAQSGLEAKLAGVRSSIADNVAATYQSEQDAIQARVDAANNQATAASAKLSIRQRVRTLVGGTALAAQGAPSNEQLGKQQAGIDVAQASALQTQMRAAARSGNAALASQLLQQIKDLQTSAAEAIESGISADVDEINRQAARTTAAIGVKQRIATALGNTDQLAALDTAQAAADQQQIVALKTKQAAAIKAGDTALAEQIGDSINDLTASVVEASAQALSDATNQINQVYSRQQAGINVKSRIATALGDVGGIDAATGALIASTQSQVQDLTAQMQAAAAAGDTGLADSISDNIDDLNATITELTAQRLQAAIDAVNSNASRQAAAVGLTNRLADLQEKAGNTAAAFAMRASALQANGVDIVSQRDQLLGLLATAQSEGNQTDINTLSDQIADLNVQIQENTDAIEENTTAARQAAIDAITNRGSFLGGVYGGIQTLVTTLGQLSGTTNTSQLSGLLGQAGGVLQQTGSGLLASLKSDFGIDLTGQSPTQIAASLSGLNYDRIESGMPVDMKTQFENLINSIIDNTNSQVSNTQQLLALTAADTQTFTSTAWQWFRSAIFNGAGGLLPQYQNAALGITSAMPVGGATAPTAAMAAASASSSSGGGVFAPSITNVEQTVDMDAETLSARLLFQYKNRPKS